MRNKIVGILLITLFLETGLVTGIFSELEKIDKTIYVFDEAIPPFDGTLEHPYKHIQDGIDNATNGDTVFVYNGTYYENLVVNKIINLIGENKNITIIDANQKKDTLIILADYVNLSGFTITGSGKESFYVDTEKLIKRYNYSGIVIYGDKDIISNNIIKQNGIGLHIRNRCSVLNNNITDNFDDGVSIADTGGNSFIIYNNIYNNGKDEESNQADGIELNYCTNVIISNNTIYKNHIDGIWVDTGDINHFIGNEIYDNGNNGIHMSESSRSILFKNKIYKHHVGRFFIAPFTSGIFLLSGEKNKIYHNCIYDNTFGIHSKVGLNNEIYNNSISNNICGIWLATSMNINIHDNDIRNNQLSFGLWSSNKNIVNKNNILSSNTILLFSWASSSNFLNNWWGSRDPTFRTIRLPNLLINTLIIRPCSFFEFNINVDC